MKTRYWIGIVCGWLVGMAGTSGAEQVYSWAEVYAGSELPEGAALDPEAGTLVVTGKAGAPSTVRLLTIEDPAVQAKTYALSGRVAYRDVEGEAYLEMWNVFADGSRYFTRTLSEGGPMGTLTGTAAARDFALPFNRSGSTSGLDRLEVNLVLPGDGVVRLETVTLQDRAMVSGLAIPGRTWLAVSLCSGVGVLVAAVTLWRRRVGDTTEARKMQAMDV